MPYEVPSSELHPWEPGPFGSWEVRTDWCLAMDAKELSATARSNSQEREVVPELFAALEPGSLAEFEWWLSAAQRTGSLGLTPCCTEVAPRRPERRRLSSRIANDYRYCTNWRRPGIELG